MTRKKHTHQTKSEEHAEVVATAPEVVETTAPKSEAQSEAEPTDPFRRAAVDAQTRLQKLVKSAQDMARARLAGTRLERLIDGLPARLEKRADDLLDRVGLVRKKKMTMAAAE